ncbi:unnamed protein product [Adineta steineri]|uniref:Uncharacterized protein n=1 Tax=Adineta steineri TaxID=433720 RepID=A0A814X0C1_9BILA|nr:unnamed protein product [Adineta steineri]
MSDTFLDNFNAECTTYFNSEFNTRLLSSSSTDKSTACEYYLAEYQRCMNEQKNFINYIHEQRNLIDNLKSCETTIDTFLERLKIIHEYELKQNEIFEQILHELTKINPSKRNLLDNLKSCETTIDIFLERLKIIHEYELKQNEIFEQILHELTKINPSSKEERIRLLGQIDELIASKPKLTGNITDNNPTTTTKLMAKSSDTFKIIL